MSEVSTICPRPLALRAWRADTTPSAARIPALMSAIGEPDFTGGPPGSPVIDMSPENPCAMRSKPPLSAYGPVRP